MTNVPPEILQRAEEERRITDAFLKDLDAICEKHNVYFGISKPQYIIQPRAAKAPEAKVDLEGLPDSALEEMRGRYTKVLEKVPSTLASIQAEFDRRKKLTTK